MVYTRLFETDSAYWTEKPNFKLPNVSYVRNGKVYYNPLFHKREETKAGDIVMYDTTNGYSYAPYETYTVSKYEGRTPIGIVVVPYTHTPDSTIRIMSLKNMSMKDPVNGTLASAGDTADTSMYWGDSATSVPNITVRSAVVTTDTGGTDHGSSSYALLPSDNFAAQQYHWANPNDPDTYWYSEHDSANTGDSQERKVYPWAPSPYNADDSVNELYRSEGNNALNDFGGAANTAAMWAAAAASAKTAATVENALENYPPAVCCHRYATVGMAAGKWYLPASGELGYVMPKLLQLNVALDRLGSTYAVKLGSTVAGYGYGSWLWASTEYSATYARHQLLNYGYVNGTSKADLTTGNRVRAFAAL